MAVRAGVCEPLVRPASIGGLFCCETLRRLFAEMPSDLVVGAGRLNPVAALGPRISARCWSATRARLSETAMWSTLLSRASRTRSNRRCARIGSTSRVTGCRASTSGSRWRPGPCRPQSRERFSVCPEVATFEARHEQLTTVSRWRMPCLRPSGSREEYLI